MSPTLEAALLAVPDGHKAKAIEHLKGGTSADWLASWFSRFGTPVSATTIRQYRRQKGA